MPSPALKTSSSPPPPPHSSFSSQNNFRANIILENKFWPDACCRENNSSHGEILSPTSSRSDTGHLDFVTRHRVLKLLAIPPSDTLGNLFTIVNLGKVAVSFTHTIKAMEPFFSVMLSAMFRGEGAAYVRRSFGYYSMGILIKILKNQHLSFQYLLSRPWKCFNTRWVVGFCLFRRNYRKIYFK